MHAHKSCSVNNNNLGTREHFPTEWMYCTVDQFLDLLDAIHARPVVPQRPLLLCGRIPIQVFQHPLLEKAAVDAISYNTACATVVNK